MNELTTNKNDGMSPMQRMDIFLNYLKEIDYKLTDNRVAVMSGLAAGIFTNGRKRNAIAYSSIIAIGKTFPELNTDWVIYGKGEMIIHKSEQTDESQSVIEFLKDWIAKLQKENDNLRLEISKLQISCPKNMLTTQNTDIQ